MGVFTPVVILAVTTQGEPQEVAAIGNVQDAPEGIPEHDNAKDLLDPTASDVC